MTNRQVSTENYPEVQVQATHILCTKEVVYNAYEPTTWDGHGWAHSLLTRFDGDSRWWGEISRRRLPPEIDALPRGDERSRAITAWRKGLDDDSIELILAAFPHLRDEERLVTRWDNEISEQFLTEYAARQHARGDA